MKTLPQAVIDAINKLTTEFVDHTHPAVRSVRLFVLDWDEVFLAYLDRILVELLIAALPIPKGTDSQPFAAHIEDQVARMSFRTKLELLKPSLVAYPKMDVEALINLHRLRNDFAHSSASIADFTYKGRSLWQEATIQTLSHDVLELGLILDEYFYSIDEFKRIAARKPVSMPRYIVLAGWEK